MAERRSPTTLRATVSSPSPPVAPSEEASAEGARRDSASPREPGASREPGGEKGRSPKVNARAGRDHWSYLYNILLTGAGVKQGYVHGASDDKAERPTANPVTPADFIATLYAAMGIDPAALLEDSGGRPRPMTPGGTVIREIVG